MRKITYREALNEAYKEEMRCDKRVITFGEDIGTSGGNFQVTKDLLKEFGPERVMETPMKKLILVLLDIPTIKTLNPLFALIIL